MPICFTLFGWTDVWAIPGISEPLEYAYYATTLNPYWTSHDTDRFGKPPTLNVT